MQGKTQILEIDELFSYCQKKLTKSRFGLLLIESEIRLLTEIKNFNEFIISHLFLFENSQILSILAND